MQQIALFPPLWKVSERAKPIDWYAVIADLYKLGFSNTMIAQQIGIKCDTTVWSWYNEQTKPNHLHGDLMIELWCRVTGRGEPPRR